MKFRTGRKVGRTIYRQFGDEPSDDDELIGLMDDPHMAEAVVEGLNAQVEAANTLGWRAG